MTEFICRIVHIKIWQFFFLYNWSLFLEERQIANKTVAWKYWSGKKKVLICVSLTNLYTLKKAIMANVRVCHFNFENHSCNERWKPPESVCEWSEKKLEEKLTPSIGYLIQNFSDVVATNNFYVDCCNPVRPIMISFVFELVNKLFIFAGETIILQLVCVAFLKTYD